MFTVTVVSHYPKIGDALEEQTLRKALAQFDRKEIDRAELERVKDEVTRRALEEQIEAGVEVVTDGQIRWDDPVTYLARQIQGFKPTGLLRYFDTNTFYRQPVCEEALEGPESFVVKDFQFANTLSSVPVKPVLTGPFTLAKLSQDRHYHDLEAFAGKLASLLGEEVERLAAAGATVVQFDEPALLSFKKEFPLFKKTWMKLSRHFPEDLEVVLFLNFGDLSGIFTQLLELPFTTLGLDLATGSGNWKLFQEVSLSKKLIAGIVDARNTKMETEEEVHEKLEALSRPLSPENLSVSPNYGLEYLPRESARKKLANLSKIVREFREAKVKG